MSAWTRIQHIEVPAGNMAEIEFLAIPNTYTDLAILISARSTRSGFGNDDLYLRFNNSTSNFSTRVIEGVGSGTPNTGSAPRYIGAIPANSATANAFGSILLYIPNYASSNAKNYRADAVQENAQTTAYQFVISGLWNPSPQQPITSVAIDPANGSLVQYSSATLYGITKGSSGGVSVS